MERGHTAERRLYEKEREDVERGHTRRENIDGEVTQTGRRLHGEKTTQRGNYTG